jgi:hypothetical protein
MATAFLALLLTLRSLFRRQKALEAEVLALRHQMLVLRRQLGGRQIQLRKADRILWVWLSRVWADWRDSLVIVQPETVIRWHRQGFCLY